MRLHLTRHQVPALANAKPCEGLRPCGTRRPLEWQRSGLSHQIFAPSTSLKKLGAQVGGKITRRTVRKRTKKKACCSLLLAAPISISSLLLVD